MPTRTRFSISSGVLPIPFYTRPEACGGACIYCPREPGLPHSYIDNEDTAAARLASFLPHAQLARFARREIWPGTYGLPAEAIILGGSFSALPDLYRVTFMQEVHTALSGHSGTFDDPSSWANGNLRCSVLTVECRPDQITREECRRLLLLGVTKVELGVQHLDNRVLEAIDRGHSAEQVATATELLKNHGFKVGYHIMLGLPGSNLEADHQMCVEELWHPRYTPDYLKVYPCVLLVDQRKQPRLHRLYHAGHWRPISDDQTLSLLDALFAVVPHYVRISRVQRQFSPGEILAGPRRSLRHLVHDQGRDIRACEVGRVRPGASVRFMGELHFRIESTGADRFIFLETQDGTLVGLVRLRFLGPLALLRELRIFGDATPIGKDGPAQGMGLGTRLLEVAERIAVESMASTLAVNAGFGVRGFFISRGYVPTTDGLLTRSLKQITS